MPDPKKKSEKESTSVGTLSDDSSIYDPPVEQDILEASAATRNEKDGSDYDPHLFRTSTHPTTNMETLVHLIKGLLGIGILAMPQAFYYAGWVNGLISLFLIGALCTYCFHMLVKAQYVLCKRFRIPLLTYSESMRVALYNGPEFMKKYANSSRLIVDVFLITYQLGACCAYLIFTAENIKQICDFYMKAEWSFLIYCTILVLPLILINSIGNLKILAPFSTFANILTFIGLAITFYYVLSDFPDTSTRQEVGTIKNYCLFFGTTLFSLEAVGVIVQLENNMKNPKNFGGYFGVLNIGMGSMTILYAIFGLLGYMKYGSDAKGSITLNLPQKEVLAQIIILIMAVAIFISYGLQSFVPVYILWKMYMKKRLTKSHHKKLWKYGLRIATVLITYVFAVGIPRIGLFISLVGCLCLSTLGLVFPAIIDLCTYWPNELGPLKYVLFKDIFVIIIGIIGFFVGTYTSVNAIIKSFKNHPGAHAVLSIENSENQAVTEEEYDPYLNRNRPHPTTNFETISHLTKSSLGTGIMTMPQAVHHAGVVVGFISTFLLGGLCVYCIQILVKAQYVQCKRLKKGLLTYPESMKVALDNGPKMLRRFANMSPIIVEAFMVAYQLGISTVCYLFIGQNVKRLCDHYTREKHSIKIYCTIILIPIILITTVRNLKILAPFSTFANIITFIGLAIVIYYMFRAFPHHLSDRHLIGTVHGFGLFFGTTLFALAAVGVIINLENNMETPKDFGGYCGVFNISMTFVTILYAFFGTIGYLRYGEDIHSSITLNVPPDEYLAQTAVGLFALAIYISYGLQAYVPVYILWDTYIKKLVDNKNKLVWEHALRVLTVLVTYTMAVAIPRIGLMISLIGCVCLSALGFLFPAIIEMCTYWPDELGPFYSVLIKDILLMLIGTIGFSAGTYSCVYEIVTSFKHPEDFI